MRPSRTLVLVNVLEPEDLEDDDEYDDIERVRPSAPPPSPARRGVKAP